MDTSMHSFLQDLLVSGSHHALEIVDDNAGLGGGGSMHSRSSSPTASPLTKKQRRTVSSPAILPSSYQQRQRRRPSWEDDYSSSAESIPVKPVRFEEVSRFSTGSAHKDRQPVLPRRMPA